jgi:hypothetical protein
MRSCPNCHKEIQDEAVFCRFCRREVDPPLWLTSLQKCPFCAEWVERGIERCPLCGKDLSQATPFSIPVEKVEQATDLFARLRQSTQAADSFDDEEDEETQTEEADYDEPEAEMGIEEMQVGRSGSWFDRLRKTPEARPAETEEGLAVLHNRRIDLSEDFAPDTDRESTPEDNNEPPNRHFLDTAGIIFRWLLIAVTASVIMIVGVLGYQRMMSARLVLPGASETPQDTPQVQPSEASPTLQATLPPGTPGVLLPTLPGTTLECITWDQITLQMAGETVCAYGAIKRWFEVSDIPYVAIFSEQPGTFAFIDRERTYPEYRPGTCITATGLIEIMRATRPFIDVVGNLQECAADLQSKLSTATPNP